MGSLTRLLIANRGEIAVRLARAAREEGLVPLGVYSEADRDASFLKAMEDAAPIGPAQAGESYLRIENILAAARTLRVDAIHPGYGFLSERPAFAQAVLDAGLVFVGPPPAAMLAVGDKGEAKRLARACGVPVLPGYDGEEQSPLLLRAQATLLGAPLLIKAAAGGGGRGMRIVENLNAFDQSLEEAKREALAGFGDDRVLLERYLARPRHIEFQILADAHGNAIYIGERDCSVQRRRQKIIEEAPAHRLNSTLQARMGEAAVRIARAAGYVNAGTAEFLVENESFYFLEMNARLQVEHPVTEEAYGIDIVRQQLRIALGKPLTTTQTDIVPRAWAIEARINAEEPDYQALPATGTIVEWNMPSGPGIRIDSGVAFGSEISLYYDSLLAKIIVSAPSRAEAIERLSSALNACSVNGVSTNVPLLLAITQDADFRSGNISTAFFEEHKALFDNQRSENLRASFLIALGALVTDSRVWRIASVGLPISLLCEETAFDVVASRVSGDDAWILVGDIIDLVAIKRDKAHIIVSGKIIHASGRAHVTSDGIDVFCNGAHAYFVFNRSRSSMRARVSKKDYEQIRITAPMPGKVARIAVQTGDAVRKHDLLLILEAMKIEHRIEAPSDGKIRAIHVIPESLVAKGVPLIDLYPTAIE